MILKLIYESRHHRSTRDQAPRPHSPQSMTSRLSRVSSKRQIYDDYMNANGSEYEEQTRLIAFEDDGFPGCWGEKGYIRRCVNLSEQYHSHIFRLELVFKTELSDRLTIVFRRFPLLDLKQSHFYYLAVLCLQKYLQ